MIPWRTARDGVLAGLVGTAVMTGTLAVERRLRRDHPTFVDYDASEHVVTATAAVLRVRPRTSRQKRALFLLTHWGYGSAVAVAHEVLRTRATEPVAAPVFYALCQSMAFSLFPTIGGTPPPWRWRRDVLATSLVQHAVYASSVAATSALLRARQAKSDTPSR